jgi:hypothetical protein
MLVSRDCPLRQRLEMHHLGQSVHQLRPQVPPDRLFHRGPGILPVFFLSHRKANERLRRSPSRPQIPRQNNHRLPEVAIPPLRIRLRPFVEVRNLTAAQA